MLRPPKKKLHPPKEILNTFYVGILYDTIPTSMQIRTHITDFRKKLEIPMFVTNIDILITNTEIFQKLVSPLPTSCVPLGGRVPQVGNPCSNVLYV
jgi:hypothetical protein